MFWFSPVVDEYIPQNLVWVKIEKKVVYGAKTFSALDFVMVFGSAVEDISVATST